MELKRVDLFLLKALYLLAVGIVVTQALNLSSLTSLLFLLTFPLTVFLWLRSVRQTVTGLDLLMLLTAALACICVLMDLWIHRAVISFGYIRKGIIFVMTLLFLQTAYRFRANQELMRFVNRTVDILTVFLIVMFVGMYSQMHILNGRVTGYLTFRIGNPNLTGLFLVCLYMLELYRLFLPEKWFWKLIHIGLAAALAFFVVESRSRNSFLVLILFTVVCSWLMLRGGKRMRIGKGVSYLIACLPALFVAGYMMLISSAWIQNLFSFMVGEGKQLDSRVEIWNNALNNLAGSPLIGAYFEMSNGTGMFQMHNSHLDVAVSYGIPVLVLVCVLLQKYLYQRGRIYEDKQNYIYILGFACSIMLGLGEAALFSGGLGLYVFVGTFLLLSDLENAAAEG